MPAHIAVGAHAIKCLSESLEKPGYFCSGSDQGLPAADTLNADLFHRGLHARNSEKQISSKWDGSLNGKHASSTSTGRRLPYSVTHLLADCVFEFLAHIAHRFNRHDPVNILSTA